MSDEDTQYFIECENEYFETLTTAKKRVYLTASLRSRVLDIEYTKKDGSARPMRATLVSDYLPDPQGRPVHERTIVQPVRHRAQSHWRPCALRRTACQRFSFRWPEYGRPV